MSECIYGMVDYCYNGLPVIRGYCSYKTLVKYSQPHNAYQRVANDKHVEEIKQFLSGTSGYQFMPEIILSYNYSGLFKGKFAEIAAGTTMTPVGYLLNNSHSGTVELIDSDYKITLRKVKLNTANANMIRITLPELGGLFSVAPIPFYRIDGNHRLEALSELKPKDFKIPFCIVLLADLSENEKKERLQIEMEIFHNINAKAKPLLPVEQYRGLFNLFTVDELMKFGEEFSITKEYISKHGALRFQNMSSFFVDKEDIVLECIRFLRFKEHHITADDVADILSKLEHTYFSDFIEIRNCKNRHAIIPYAFFCLEGNKQKSPKLDAYNTWFVKNRLYDVVDFDAGSMVDVFNNIYEIRKKQVFVAMPFKDELNFVFTTISKVIGKLNRENGINLLPPIRIDKQIVGFSYDIVEEILNNIQNAGILIADLTYQNANVYYEAGFAQGLLRAKFGTTAKILYLLSNPDHPDEPFADGNAKFDVGHYKMLPYKNDGNGRDELEALIEKELKEFYCI